MPKSPRSCGAVHVTLIGGNAMLLACRPLLLLTLALVFAPAWRAGAVTLDDPTNFQVKNTFSGPALGVPGPLGGLSFSADGTLLYIVGGSESDSSALYS